MNGPDHYVAAEGLIRGAARYAERTEDGGLTAEEIRDLKASVMSSLAAAQVHATLALAAATATLIPLRDAQGANNVPFVEEWTRAGAL